MNLRPMLLGIGLALFTSPAMAQSKYARPLPPPTPIVSPYLNLLRGGASPGFNYATLVRPQLDTQSNIEALQKGLQTQEKALSAVSAAEAEPVTGHAVGFMTHNRYFMTFGRGITSGVSGLSTTAARPTTPSPRPTGRGPTTPTTGLPARPY